MSDLFVLCCVVVRSKRSESLEGTYTRRKEGLVAKATRFLLNGKRVVSEFWTSQSEAFVAKSEGGAAAMAFRSLTLRGLGQHLLSQKGLGQAWVGLL